MLLIFIVSFVLFFSLKLLINQKHKTNPVLLTTESEISMNE